MPDGPTSGTLIVLRDPADQAYSSRVEARQPGVITAVRPGDTPAAEPYPVGTAFDVLWTEPSGLHVVPVELSATRSAGKIRLWDFAITGEPWIDQRREFVRVPLFGRMTLVADAGDDRQPIAGYLIDLSEAAVQCCLWASPDDARLTIGRRVRCDFTVLDETFRRDAVVYAARRGAGRNETLAVVQFEQSAREADRLRRQVFAIQVQMRHTWKRQRS